MSSGTDDTKLPRRHPFAGTVGASSMKSMAVSREEPGLALGWGLVIHLGWATAVGAMLRWFGLGRALMMDDEVHALRLIASEPAAELWFRYGASDPCWPLALWGELGVWSSLRWGLEVPLELWLRAPVALASTVAVMVLPLLAVRFTGRSSAVVWGGLLALSPLLVLFGRVARPYGVLAATVPAAALLLVAWGRRPTLPRVLSYGALVGISAALSPLMLPALLAPALVAGVWSLTRKADSDLSSARRWWWAGGLALVSLGSLALALGPALGSLLALADAKAGASLSPPPGAVFRLLAGVSAAPPPLVTWGAALALGVLATLGGLVLARRGTLGRPREEREQSGAALAGPWLLALLLSPVLAQVFALAWLSPFGWANPLIAARYLMPTLPLVLLLVAVGALAVGRGTTRGGARAVSGVRGLAPWWCAALLVAMMAALCWDALSLPGGASFRTHNDFLRFERAPARIAVEQLPPAMGAMTLASPGVATSAGPRRGAILQLPLRHEGHFSRAPYAWAAHHRRPVISAGVETFPCAEGFDVQRTVCPRPEDLARIPASYLVVVLDPEAEERRVRGLSRPTDPRPRRWQAMRSMARRLAQRLEANWGPPMAADDRILIWNLDQVRDLTSAPSPPHQDKLTDP